MEIYGVQKLTLLDYPEKTACTLFSGGCNFRCPFCHNSDLVLGVSLPCDTEELFAFLKKRAGLLDGVCITGGEPLLNEDIGDFIKKIRALGYQVKLDTNGSKPALLSALISDGLVDYVAMDIKNSPERYGETVGIPCLDISPILESISILLKNRVDYEFRTTLTRELHPIDAAIDVAELLRGAKRYFLQSYTESDKVLQKGLQPPAREQTEKWKEIISPYVNSINIRG